jgi:uncharacterized protein (DUF924 family)
LIEARYIVVSEARDDSQNAASGAEKVLLFWFADEPGSKESMLQSRWFFPTPEFDQLCTTRFLANYEDAAHGRLDDWKNEPRSCLALVLLLDQFPRNMFRGTARAFATDAKARELSRHAIESGFDLELSLIMRMFLYLPLEHSENPDDQLESVQLTSALVAENPDYTEFLDHAVQHLEVIRRFGRFPGRNNALGRDSTQEEMNFLKDQKWS